MDRLRRHRADGAAVLAGLATTVILAGRISRGFDFDEATSVLTTIRRGSALVPLTETTVFNNHRLFSVIQSVWWSIGGDGEARQRVLPILYGALAVAILVGWLARRLGLVPALAGGAVLMLNPMFVTEARDVRGYSLATLAVVVASVTLVEWVRREDDARGSGSPWLLVAHVAAVVVGMGTHLFAGVALGAVGIGALIVLRRFELRLFGAWAVAGLLTVALHLPTLDEMRATAEDRGTLYRPWFGRVTSWEVLGRDRLTSTVVALVATVGLVALFGRRVTERRGVGVAGLVVGVLVVAQGLLFWQVISPFDLYPRFFLTSVPLIAIAVAFGVARLRLLGVVVAGALVFTLGNVGDARASTSGIREVAAVVATANAQGLDTCAVGGRPMIVYGAPATELRAAEEERLADCDVFVVIGSWGQPLVDPARDQFVHEERVGGIRVFSRVAVDALHA